MSASDVAIQADSLRLGVFAGSLVTLAVLERAWPRRQPVAALARRWTTHGILLLLGALLARLAVPLGMLGAAEWARIQSFGGLHRVELPSWIEIGLAIVLLDLAVFGQHVASHRIDLLWRFHRVHHADLDLDASSGFRFHPFEIAASLVWKAGCAAALGAPAIAVVASEILLSTFALFTHANLRLPAGVDAFARVLLVTPDVHRVHHSTQMDETNSNFGFALIVWDRLFGTLRPQPRAPHSSMELGLSNVRAEDEASSTGSLLALPFRSRSRGGGPD